MNNLSNRLSKYRLATLVFCCCLLFGYTLQSYAQFTANPQQVNIPSEDGRTFILLEMGGASVQWQATTSEEWLTLTPAEGNGITEIMLEFDNNDRLRRAADIIIVDVAGEFDTLKVEVRQLQGFPMDFIPMDLEIVLRPWEEENTLPYVGRIRTEYLPFEEAAFLNVMATSPNTEDSVWIVQNVYLPAASWTDTLQKLSVKFDLGSIGIEPGGDPGTMGMTYCLSYLPDSTMPKIPSDKWFEKVLGSFVNSPWIPIVNDSIFRDPFVFALIKMSLPHNVKDLAYIGCKMPIGDLNADSIPGDEFGCGPAAAANSLKWMEKEFDSIQGLPAWRVLYEQLRTTMGLVGNNNYTYAKEFIQGKLDIIEAYDLPIVVKYQSDERRTKLVKSTSGNSQASNHGSTPQKNFIINELKDDEDVEIFFSKENGIGHIVALSGTVTVNNKTSVYYKHDADQELKGGPDHAYSLLIEKDGKLKLTSESGIIHNVISESYDPTHTQPPTSVRFEKYCTVLKRTLPPGGSFSFTFPTDPKRTFGMTIRVWDKAASPGYRTKARWIGNSGKTRTFKNTSKNVVTLFIHNDDYSYKKVDGVRMYKPFTINITKKISDPAGVTDPSNDVGLDGFSIGGNDNSSAEFGESTSEEVVFVDSLNSDLTDFPARLSSSGTKKVSIQKPVGTWNRFWKSLDLVLGIDSVINSGYLRISSQATGINDSIYIAGKGETIWPIGGLNEAGLFDLDLEIDDNLDIIFDNVGIPSSLQLFPGLQVDPDTIRIWNSNSGDTSFTVTNIGQQPLNWYFGESADWFSVSPNNGLNEAEIILNYTINKGPAREYKLSIQSTEEEVEPKTIVIFQDASSSGIEDVENEANRARFYPNPVGDKLFIETDFTIESLTIYDLYGKSIITQTDQLSEIDLTNLNKGVYVVVAIIDGTNVIRKIVKN